MKTYPGADAQVLGRLGRMYKNGVGTDKNLDAAIRLLAIANDAGITWAFREYVDALIESNAPFDIALAHMVLNEGLLKDKGFTYCRLSRLYADGKGVRKDIFRAIELMAKAIEINKTWILEYVNLLIISKSKDNLEKAYQIYPSLSDLDKIKLEKRWTQLKFDKCVQS